MKKFLSLLLAVALLGTTCLASAPADVEFTFKIENIKHYTDPSSPLSVNVSVPSTYENGTLLMTFYSKNRVTKVVPVNVSSKTNSGNIEFPIHFEEGDGHPLTPDRIRLFLWNKGTLKPLAYSEDVLTSAVIEEANRLTSNYILKYFVTQGTTKGIPDALGDHLDEPKKYPNVDAALTLLEECAQIANNNKSTMLLTHESTKRLLGEKFDTLIAELQVIDEDQAQKNELIRIHTAAKLTTKQNYAVEYLAAFFKIKLPI